MKFEWLKVNQEPFLKFASNHNTQPQNGPMFFGALNGFRGLLAVFVAIYHTYWTSNINGSAFFNHGPVIIDLFFVFSGFLLFTLYAKKLTESEQVGRFFKKRIARLYPLHIFTLGLFLVLAALRVGLHKFGYANALPDELLPFQAGSHENWSAVMSHLSMTHSMGLHEQLTFNVPSWTISVEMFAYVTLAAMLLWFPPRKPVHFVALAVFVALIYLFLSRIKPDMDITHDYGFFRCLAGFYTGVITAYLFQRVKCKELGQSWSVKMATGLELFTVLICVVFVIYCPGKLQFFIAPFLCLFVFVFAQDRGLVSRFMMSAPFTYLARISYAVYMCHMIVAVVFFALLSKFFGSSLEQWSSFVGDLLLVPYLVVVFALSHLAHKYVEVPGNLFVLNLRFSVFRSSKRSIANP